MSRWRGELTTNNYQLITSSKPSFSGNKGGGAGQFRRIEKGAGNAIRSLY
jgi:hypothetical protein